MNIASTQHHLVRPESSNQLLYDVSDKSSPFFLAVLLQATDTDVVLKGGLFVGQVAKLHRLDNSIDNHGGPEASSETEEQHLAALVTPERLHRCIIHDFNRTFEGCFKVKTGPSFAKIPWFRNRPIPDDRTRITNGDGFILPIGDQFPHAANHSLWRQSRPGIKFSPALLTGHKDLYVSPANINYQHIHGGLHGAKRVALET